MSCYTQTHLRLTISLLLLVFLVGCSGNAPSDNNVITNPADLDKHVGEAVVIRGKLEKTKAPSVLGVTLSKNYIQSEDMFGKQVECTGKLQREVITNAPPQAQRGDGTHYFLIDVSEDKPLTVTVIE